MHKPMWNSFLILFKSNNKCKRFQIFEHSVFSCINIITAQKKSSILKYFPSGSVISFVHKIILNTNYILRSDYFVNVYICVFACMHAYVQTTTHAYIHTYVHTYIQCGHIWHRNKLSRCQLEPLVSCSNDEHQTSLKWDSSSHPVTLECRVSHTLRLKHFAIKVWRSPSSLGPYFLPWQSSGKQRILPCKYFRNYSTHNGSAASLNTIHSDRQLGRATVK